MLENLVNVIAAAEPAASGNMVADLAGKFGVDWNILVAQIINFGLVAFLLYRFAFKPVIETLDTRQSKIAEGLQYAEEMELKLKDAEKKHAELIKEASLEAKKIVDTARSHAKAYTEQQTQEAVAKAEGILKKAEEATKLERDEMYRKLRKDLAGLVVETSGKVLSVELSTEERSRFSESAAKQLSVN